MEGPGEELHFDFQEVDLVGGASLKRICRIVADARKHLDHHLHHRNVINVQNANSSRRERREAKFLKPPWTIRLSNGRDDDNRLGSSNSRIVHRVIN